jgi:hypothetical protein
MRVNAREIRARGAARYAFSRGHWLSHAKDVAIRATRRVAYDDHATVEYAEADDPGFTVVSTDVIDLEHWAREDDFRVLEIKPAFLNRSYSLGRIVRDWHKLL